MAFFDWKDGYSVGIASIDTQHKKLISLINDIAESITGGQEGLITGNLLNELEQYSIYHFSQEEILFQEYGYGKAKEHEEGHEAYIRGIQSLRTSWSSSDNAATIPTIAYLKKWLENHFQKDDMDYAGFIRDSDKPI
jgi:hemerythrin-like metal-binding protein